MDTDSRAGNGRARGPELAPPLAQQVGVLPCPLPMGASWMGQEGRAVSVESFPVEPSHGVGGVGVRELRFW